MRTRDKVRIVLQVVAILLIDVIFIGVFYLMFIALWLIAG